MNIVRKLDLARQSIESIARHDDADEAVVQAALDGLVKHIAGEGAAAKERRACRRAAALAELKEGAGLL